MKKQITKKRNQFSSLYILITLFIVLLGGNITQAASFQDTTKNDTLEEKAPNVFLDCNFCDLDHIKREISYVNYVRDRIDADVHVMITRERAANRGERYSVFLIGQNGYENLQDTLRFNVAPDVSEEESRQQLLHALKTGLTSYLIKTPLWQNLNINYTKSDETKEEVEDKWNFWIFEVGTNARLSGESSRKGYDFGGEFEANKVTEDIKLEFEINADYERDIYEVDTETITSIHRTYDFEGLAAWSLSQHWSAGGFAGLRSSRYENIRISYNAAPAIEFNVFPYAESTTRQLTLLYRPEFRYNVYQDTTIFNKLNEQLLRESLAIDYEMKKKWGSINLSLNLSHYFHDFSKNRVSFHTRVNLNIMKGLNIYLRGGASLIHDQLSLPKEEASTEEILTRQQQLATSYNYYTRFGISYTFGSMYNNIVNPRF